MQIRDVFSYKNFLDQWQLKIFMDIADGFHNKRVDPIGKFLYFSKSSLMNKTDYSILKHKNHNRIITGENNKMDIMTDAIAGQETGNSNCFRLQSQEFQTGIFQYSRIVIHDCRWNCNDRNSESNFILLNNIPIKMHGVHFIGYMITQLPGKNNGQFTGIICIELQQMIKTLYCRKRS